MKERGRVPAPPTSTVMSTPRPPVSLVISWSQSGVALVVDHGLGAHRLQPLGLGRRARGRDHARAEHPGELQGEDRDAARALHQHGVARLDAADLDQRMPGRDAGAGQGGAFLEAQACRQLHHAILFQHRKLGQHAVDRAAHRRGRSAASSIAPPTHLCMKQPATRSPTLSRVTPGPTRDDFARAVRQRDQVGLGRGARVVALDGDQVAVVERRRAHTHQHLARTGRRVRPSRPASANRCPWARG